MEILIFLLIYIVIYLAMKPTLKKTNTPCSPIHTWVYKEDGYLVCSKCKRLPGDEDLYEE